VRTEFFYTLSPARQRGILLVTIGTAVTLMMLLNIIGAPLVTPAAPGGIVTFEFAGTMAQVEEILASWDTSAKIRAGLSLGLDFIFPRAYGAAIAFSCLAVAGRGERAWQQGGRRLAAGMIAAVLLDYIENIALIQLLLGAQDEMWPLLAYWCAVIKFALILSGIGYALVVGAWRLGRGIIGRG